MLWINDEEEDENFNIQEKETLPQVIPDAGAAKKLKVSKATALPQSEPSVAPHPAPKKRGRKPKPKAADDSGSKVKEASLSCSFSIEFLNSS